MEDREPNSRLDVLTESALQRLEASRGQKPRIVVQIGHCGASVGAVELADAVRSQFSGRASVTVAGCDGACFAAPSVLVECRSGDFIRLERVRADSLRQVGIALRAESASELSSADDFIASQRRIALEGCGLLDAESIDEYLAEGGYSAFVRSLSIGPEAVIDQVKQSRLRGRGGAYFPAGIKWESARNVTASRRSMIVN